MNFFQKLTGHFSTITRHRHKVIAHCAKAGILWQGLRHDLSKYTPTEFIPGVKYYMGDRSPNEGERMDKGYSKAWLHHKGRNRHHFEYWVDYGIGAEHVLASRIIHPKTSDEIEKLLVITANEGEDAAFKCIRQKLKSQKKV